MVATDDKRRAAIDWLPLPYSSALRMRDAGIPDDLIAECIGVAPDAMQTFLQLAEAKLAARLRRMDRGH